MQSKPSSTATFETIPTKSEAIARVLSEAEILVVRRRFRRAGTGPASAALQFAIVAFLKSAAT